MFIDIAANLSDDMFNGIYHEKKLHESDLDLVVDRARENCESVIVLAGSIQDAYTCLDICQTFDPECKHLFTTVGFHPLRCAEALKLSHPGCSDQELEERIYREFSLLVSKAGPHRVVCLGEMGLDYHRLEFADKDLQLRIFKIQLRVATTKFPQLPILLHLRNAFDDFIQAIGNYHIQGVVHSFTGSLEQMQTLVRLGLYIGVNGCTLRDAFDVVPHIPEDRLLFETDSPYCDIRPTHKAFPLLAGLELAKTVKPEKFVSGCFVKSRNEPACINQVAFAVAGIRKTDFLALSEKVKVNTLSLFKKPVR